MDELTLEQTPLPFTIFIPTDTWVYIPQLNVSVEHRLGHNSSVTIMESGMLRIDEAGVWGMRMGKVADNG